MRFDTTVLYKYLRHGQLQVVLAPIKLHSNIRQEKTIPLSTAKYSHMTTKHLGSTFPRTPPAQTFRGAYLAELHSQDFPKHNFTGPPIEATHTRCHQTGRQAVNSPSEISLSGLLWATKRGPQPFLIFDCYKREVPRTGRPSGSAKQKSRKPPAPSPPRRRRLMTRAVPAALVEMVRQMEGYERGAQRKTSKRQQRLRRSHIKTEAWSRIFMCHRRLVLSSWISSLLWQCAPFGC